MKGSCENKVELRSSHPTDGMNREIRRTNARLNHFRGVAASVMVDAHRIWAEIWDELQYPGSCEEILDGKARPVGLTAEEDRSRLLDKLQLLGIRIDYARRLCEGSIGNRSHEEGDE
ncbi:MAG: hypothetical protein AB2L11_08825 [Syntrophobacteraceae bacterium]